MSRSTIHRGDWPRLKKGLRGRLFGRMRAWLFLRLLELCSHYNQWRERKRDKRGNGLRPATTCTQNTIRAVVRGGCITPSPAARLRTRLDYENDPVVKAWREYKCN